jgi:hypothetical protein
VNKKELKRVSLYVDPKIHEEIIKLSEEAGDSSITRTYHHLVELGLVTETLAQSGVDMTFILPDGTEYQLAPPGGTQRKKPRIPASLKDGKQMSHEKQ